jgi:hypothetical protein
MMLVVLGLFLASTASRAEMPDETDARALLDRWLTAQNQGNFEDYEKLYAPTFAGVRTSGTRRVTLDRDGWLADRRRMFQKKMSVTATDVRITTSKTSVSIEFTQAWSSGRYADTGPKAMVLVRGPNGLRIGREELLSSKVETGARLASSEDTSAHRDGGAHPDVGAVASKGATKALCATAAECREKGYDLFYGRIGCLIRAKAQDPKGARPYYEAACDMGDAFSCTEIGVMLLMDSPTVESRRSAIVAFQKACDLGRLYSCMFVVQEYESGKGAFEKDPPKAAELSKRLCDSGLDVGCRSLAGYYDTGFGVNTAPQKAAALRKRAGRLKDWFVVHPDKWTNRPCTGNEPNPWDKWGTESDSQGGDDSTTDDPSPE